MQRIDWEITVQKYGRSVWQSAYRILGNRADAADCFQETFLSAYEASKQHRVNNLRAFLSTVATMRAVDILRKKIRRQDVQYSLKNCENYAFETTNPDDKAESKELAEQLRVAIRKLPQIEANIFCLRVLNGLSYRQIAKHLGISGSSVGVTLHRAKKKLQSMLKKQVFEEQRQEVQNEK